MRKESYALIPKDKFDISTVDKLERMSSKEIEPILSELMFWISDANWPVANPLINILIKFPDSIFPYLKKNLSAEEEDDDLKFNIILLVLPRLPERLQKEFVTDIERICTTPTMIEKNGSLEIAQEYYNVLKRL